MTQLVNIPNYSLISKERKGKKGGGVGILTRDDLKVRHRPDLEIDFDAMENVVAKLRGDKDRIQAAIESQIQINLTFYQIIACCLIN